MRCYLLLSILILCTVCDPAVAGTVIHVPVDQPTIQSGINAAVNGDTVLVEHGLYRENLKVFGKTILLTSKYLLDRDPVHILETIIDGSAPVNADTGSCLIIYQGVGAIVQGFTITGGTGTKWFDGSDGKIYREGGGILTDATTATIRSNLIVNNSATNRTDVTSAGGGGIRCGFGGTNIIGNVIAYNQGRYGGGLVAFYAPGEISNNVFWKNSGGQDFGGAGAWIWQSDGSTLLNNTIMENTSVGAGGGVSLSTGFYTLLSNIVRDNTAVSNPQIHRTATAGTSTVQHCNVQGGMAGTGNIDRVPEYADSNFLLSLGSPCVDSGIPDFGYMDLQDIGNPGFARFPSRGSLTNDMGAYGGPKATIFPLFTSAKPVLDVASIDFGTDSVGHLATRKIPLHKLGWGLLVVDSVGFAPTNADLSAVTMMPHAIPILRRDTLVIGWNPSSTGSLSGTLRIYHNDTGAVSPLIVTLTGMAVGGCCRGATGNVDCDPDGGVDISDLSALIDNLYISLAPLCCQKEANIDGSTDGNIDISDLSALIDNLYISYTPPAACL